MSLNYVATYFENASPATWHLEDDGTAVVDLVYDRERESPNRANTHWHIQLQGEPHSDITLILRNLSSIWNGKLYTTGEPTRHCCISEDGQEWTSVIAKRQPDNTLKINLNLGETGNLYLARLEPYRISDLENFLLKLLQRPGVAFETIGSTVQGRPLEILTIGDPAAAPHLFLRARSHPWETGGNWLLEGLIEEFLKTPGNPYCLRAMPMANKDGVAMGKSRFNAQGKDLNRDWDAPAHEVYAPENVALEKWLEKQGADGRKIELAIDLHNDSQGKLHFGQPPGDAALYHNAMNRLERSMLRHTPFTEGRLGSEFHNPGTFGEGLYERYGIPACILELNAEWNAALGKQPLGADWRFYGKQMHAAFREFFNAR